MPDADAMHATSASQTLSAFVEQMTSDDHYDTWALTLTLTLNLTLTLTLTLPPTLESP